MNPRIGELVDRIRQLEEEVEAELQARRDQFNANFEHRRVRFEAGVIARQRQFKVGLTKYLLSARLRNIATAPVIYAVILPLLLLDLFVSLYQWTCFPLYGIPRVRRGHYFVFDRAHLAYLNLVEKINCLYCSYGSGLIAYTREIVARTEQYWCPIKHARRIRQAHAHYGEFVDFGDAEGFRREMETLRQKVSGLNLPP
ncbi:MAG: hypothetical protein Q8O34_14240 [Rhodocyclaceae bacterium]|nr:hypothetical protein [Rhodocyclaceae bacterium]